MSTEGLVWWSWGGKSLACPTETSAVGSGRKMAALGRVWLQVYRLANTAQFTDFFAVPGT